MKNLHPIQIQILNNLLFSEISKYSELKPKDLESSHFVFYLDALVSDKLVKKVKKGEYKLTEKGKNFTNTIDLDSNNPYKQAKHSAVFCAARNNDTEILIYQRLKSPFYGCFGFPTGKVKYGESISDTAIRELEEETSLKGKDPILVGIRHFRVYLKETRELVEDKVMYIFKIKDPIGEVKSNKEGEFMWIKMSDAQNLENQLEEYAEILEMLQSFDKNITFKETNHFTNKF